MLEPTSIVYVSSRRDKIMGYLVSENPRVLGHGRIHVPPKVPRTNVVIRRPGGSSGSRKKKSVINNISEDKRRSKYTLFESGENYYLSHRGDS